MWRINPRKVGPKKPEEVDTLGSRLELPNATLATKPVRSVPFVWVSNRALALWNEAEFKPTEALTRNRQITINHSLDLFSPRHVLGLQPASEDFDSGNSIRAVRSTITLPMCARKESFCLACPCE